MNYKDILEQYRYESDQEIKHRAAEIDKLDYEDNRDLINEIVLWKLNRSVQISDETIEKIHELAKIVHKPIDVVDCKEAKQVIFDLLESKGIKIAMASTILHFYYPSIFPIIDQRAYRELMGEDMPIYNAKGKNSSYVDLYCDYIEKCIRYKEEICPEIEFEYIDKILYQLDKNKKKKVRY